MIDKEAFTDACMGMVTVAELYGANLEEELRAAGEAKPAQQRGTSEGAILYGGFSAASELLTRSLSSLTTFR